jgi:hypothetical protein
MEGIISIFINYMFPVNSLWLNQVQFDKFYLLATESTLFFNTGRCIQPSEKNDVEAKAMIFLV